MFYASGAFTPNAPILPFIQSFGLLNFILPTIGALGCMVGLMGLQRRLPREAGFVGLAVAVSCSVFPGQFGLAPMGVLLGLLVLVAHLLDEIRASR